MKTTGLLVALAISAACSGCGTTPALEIIAHRGASHSAPENTVASTILAWERDADIVECDIHLSSDGKIMVIHDTTSGRTTGVDHIVKETSSDILRSLDAGSWKGDSYAGEKIPFLDEIIKATPSKKSLFIEIKCGPEIIPTLEAALNENDKKDSVAIITFGYETAVSAKQHMPDIPVYWLVGTQKDENTGKTIPFTSDLITKAIEGNLDGLNLNYGGMTDSFAREAKSRGLRLYVWTINDTAIAEEMAAFNVDGITTDMPKDIRAHLDR